MPAGNGTGPRGTGQGTGRGGGRGAGRGRGGGRGAGAGGECLCPQCGAKIQHQPATPCTSLSCPKCGVPMIRA